MQIRSPYLTSRYFGRDKYHGRIWTALTRLRFVEKENRDES